MENASDLNRERERERECVTAAVAAFISQNSVKDCVYMSTRREQSAHGFDATPARSKTGAWHSEGAPLLRRTWQPNRFESLPLDDVLHRSCRSHRVVVSTVSWPSTCSTIPSELWDMDVACEIRVRGMVTPWKKGLLIDSANQTGWPRHRKIVIAPRSGFAKWRYATLLARSVAVVRKTVASTWMNLSFSAVSCRTYPLRMYTRAD